MTMSDLEHQLYRQWKGWDPAQFGAFTADHAVYFQSELSACGVPDLHGRCVVELGFGNGTFAGWATAQGARYAGFELAPELVALGKSLGYTVYSSEMPVLEIFQSCSLDLVVAFDVFEHLEPALALSTLRELHCSLRAGGLLLFRVPSGDSPFSRAIQHGDLTHRMVWSSSSARQIAYATGFEVAAVRPPRFPLRGLSVRTFMRRSLVAGLRSMIYPIIAKALMGGGSPVLTPNMVCVFRKAPAGTR